MFEVVLALHVRIDGCPAAGLDAVDFREQHGLPLAPVDEIRIYGRFESQALCRLVRRQLNLSADLYFRTQIERETVVELPQQVLLTPAAAQALLAAIAAPPLTPSSHLVGAIEELAQQADAHAARIRCAEAARRQALDDLMVADSAYILELGIHRLLCDGVGYETQLEPNGHYLGIKEDGAWTRVFAAIPSPRPDGQFGLRLNHDAQQLVARAHAVARQINAEKPTQIAAARMSIVAMLGSPDQVRSQAAGALPLTELLELVRAATLARLKNWPKYEKIQRRDFTGCEAAEYDHQPAIELSFNASDQLMRVREAIASVSSIAGYPCVSDAEARVHQATCKRSRRTWRRYAFHVRVEIPDADLVVTRVLGLAPLMLPPLVTPFPLAKTP